MNDIDSILSSVGISSSPIVRSTPVITPEEFEAEREVVIPDSTVVSDEVFNAILQSNGFEQPIAEALTSPVPETPSVPSEDEPEENNDEDTMEELEESVEGGEEVENTSEENNIPLNAQSLTVDDTTARFSGASWYDRIQKEDVIIAGVGGIGSNLAFQIARACPKSVILYDNDDVESVNMSGQLFQYEDIGSKKVDAVANMLRRYTSLSHIDAIPERYNSNACIKGPNMFCGFDNMEARKFYFGTWLRFVFGLPEEQRKECLFLDGRLSINTLQVLCIEGNDTYNIQRYQEEFLFSSEEAEETICSMKQTTYLACMIASIMTNLFVNHVANMLNPIIPYNLPFFTEFDAENMIFRKEA